MTMNLRDVEPHSKWLDFELDTAEPMAVRLKVKYVPDLILADFVDVKGNLKPKLYESVFEIVLDAIIDWDLMDGKKEIQCTEENKQEYYDQLNVIFDIKVKESENSLGAELIRHARNKENFLKNLKPISAITKKSIT